MGLSGPAIKDAIHEIRILTNEPFAVNFWVSVTDRQASGISPNVIEHRIRELAAYYAELGIEPPAAIESKPQDLVEQIRAAVGAGAPVLSFVYGVPPSEIIAECRRQEITTIGTATTPEEAVVPEEAGMDLIVASGFEGGGHRGSFLGLLRTRSLAACRLFRRWPNRSKFPSSRRAESRMGAAWWQRSQLGAEGVQIATAFLPCAGSGVSMVHRNGLLKTAHGTALTNVFTGRLAKGIRNRMMDELAEMNTPPMPFQMQHALTRTVAKAAARQGRADLMPLSAGQSASLTHYT